MAEPVIELTGVTKIFNKALEEKAKTAVDDLSFQVEAGGITGFIGPNGAGKTTSIKMILGLYQPTTGKVTLMGQSAGNFEARQDVSYVSEQPYFYEHLSAEETLKFIYQLKQLPSEKMNEEIDRVLDVVELTPHRKGRVKKFSKGMQMRLNMAQALLGSPNLIIMDEPMSGLDPLGRRLFRKLFLDLSRQGITIFFSTHIVEDIESICDRIVVLSKGKLYYAGDVETLLSSTREGIEYRFDHLTQEQMLSLAELANSTITVQENGVVHLVLNELKNPDELTKILSKAKLLPSSIKTLERSLEEVLYADSEEEVA